MHTPRVRMRTKFLALLAAATIVATFGVASAMAVHDDGLFELDKDASDGLVHVKGGYLAGTMQAGSTTANVCLLTVPVGDPPNVMAEVGETIRIRQETMLVTAVQNPGTFNGNCVGTKVTYTVDRSAPPTNTKQTSGAQDVTALVSIIADSPLPASLDWDAVHAAVSDNGGNTNCDAIDLVDLDLGACAFIEDGIGPSIFTVGSTKDHLPISGWFHTEGSSPDKGEILNAFAAKATDTNGPGTADDAEILYFGMDRYAVDGSTDIGFWFLQNQVFACPDPNAGDACDDVPDGEFAGEHMTGDLLALGTFTQGGATSNIRVFTWDDEGGNPGNVNGPTDTFADCVPGGTDDEGCATVNNSTIGVPAGWDYTFKGESVGGWIPAGGFFEGGIDLTANNLEGCFASFLAETRSSPEVTAILKDFALGQFESCGATVTTTPSDGDTGALSGPAPLEDTNDNDIPDIQLGTGDAGADVTDAAVIDVTGTNDWEGTLSFYLCGPMPTDELCDGEEDGNVGVPISSQAVDGTTQQPIFSSVANVTEVGYYCWRGFFDSATNGIDDIGDATIGECFEVLPVTPNLDTESVNGMSPPVAFSGPVPFGDAVYDKAMLTGTAHEPGETDGDVNGDFTSINSTMTPADGTITFTLYVDAGEECGAAATVTSGDNPQDVTVDDGDGNYFTTGVVPDSPGVFAWAAEYSGSTSGNTEEASHNLDCKDAAENYTVQQLQPALSTAQSFIPNDAVTITVDGGAGDLEGTVTFSLWVDDATCTGPADHTFGPIDILAADAAGTLSDTAETGNTTISYAGSHTFTWDVNFTSTNPAHLSIDGVCGNENSSTTVDDGSVENTPPTP